jgi:hypothetical protein
MRKKWGSLPTFNVPTRVDKWTDDTNPYPPFSREEGGWLKTLDEASLEGAIGFDLEFSPSTGKPHLLGIASTKSSACIPWTNGAAEKVVSVAQAKSLPLVGHSVMDADKPVVESACGITTQASLWEDSMIAGYLANQDWAAQPGKTEDDDDKGSLGLMNLWTMASYYTDVPNWKRCRSAACFGPCPDHDEPYYCGIDSWSGLMVYNEAIKSIPRPLYDDLKNLTLYCSDMSRQGIALDRELIARMETQIKEKKAGLFPSEMRLRSERCTKEKRFFLTPFNPNSPAQKLEYFKSVGIPLMGKGRQEKADKDTIRKALEQQLRKLRVTYEVDRKSSQLFISDDDISLPEPVEYLYRLDQYMRSGKGLKSWFDDKYIGDDGFVHPRFIITGTSTGRLASSGPNFQNVPKRGFGALVRAAIVPRNSLLTIGKADKGQLELRIVLFYAGAEQPPNDAFTWLVEKSQGAFKEAASRFAMKERDIAKSLAHAANYLEGLVHLTDDELRTQTRQREIKAGALVVFDDWEYRSGYVGFTGANLAERLFGDRSYEHRKEALALQELYFKAFPSIREWHRKVSREIESTRRITSHTGRALRLYGTPEDDLKLACAFLGQGGGADEVQEGMLRYQSLGKIALIQVHDELVFELPKEYTDNQVMKFFDVFCEPSVKFGGWRFPIEVNRGDNWCGWDAELNPGGLRVIK